MTRTFQEYQAEKQEREWKERVKARKEKMGNAERVERAAEWKNIGNEKFKAGNLPEARDYYREAIIFVEDLVDARRQERNELLVPLYCNLAQVNLRLGDPAGAAEVAARALAIAEVPRNAVSAGLRAKAQFRRGLARRALGKNEEARDDFLAVLKLQPESEEVTRELAAVRATLAEEARKAREQMGGFLQREADERKQREERQRRLEERRGAEEEKRRERRALAEQRQQMQGAFEKLSKGTMLYEQREKEMEPIRKKEEEKKKTLELEQNLLNIIDSSKGLPKTEKFDEFMEKKHARCTEQHNELDQKKKILDKHKKEQQWDEDDAWRGQRDEHRRRLEAEREAGALQTGPPSLWEAKEVARWCEQRLRDVLLGTFVEGDALAPELAVKVSGKDAEKSESAGYVLKALVTDVLKLAGDASVVRLNAHKAPLYYYDYFLKLDWEVALARPGERAYRTADELITVAAKGEDCKAPPSVVPHRVLAGTFKVRELCSEEEPADGAWPVEAKVKQPCSHGQELATLADGLRERLAGKVQRLLTRWAEEYREHWA